MSCECGKAGFASKRHARDVARRARGSSSQKPYRCPDDPKVWHLTSQGKIRPDPSGRPA